MNPKTLIIIGISAVLAVCAAGKSGDVYTRDQVRQVQTYRIGYIEGVREIRIEGTKTPIGTAAGAVVGGVAGSSVGNGKTGQIGAVVGAVVGGMVGAATEEGITRENGFEFDIRMEDGSYISVVQAKAVKDETFAVGDRVRIINSAGVVRVAH